MQVHGEATAKAPLTGNYALKYTFKVFTVFTVYNVFCPGFAWN